MSEDTKVCPYCAETIKAAAVVCRFCGRDLPAAEPLAAILEPIVPGIEKKPQKRKLRNILIVLIALLLLCICGMIFLVDSTPGSPETISVATSKAATRERSFTLTSVAPEPTLTTAPTNTPEPTRIPAPPFAEIADNYNTMTDAQWEAYAKTLKGAYAENWTGKVEEVDVGEILGGYTIYIDAGRETFVSEVYVRNVPEDLALSIKKDQPVTFSGVIDHASDAFSLGIYFDAENVTFDFGE